jgi:hypothetical protein
MEWCPTHQISGQMQQLVTVRFHSFGADCVSRSASHSPKTRRDEDGYVIINVNADNRGLSRAVAGRNGRLSAFGHQRRQELFWMPMTPSGACGEFGQDLQPEASVQRLCESLPLRRCRPHVRIVRHLRTKLGTPAGAAPPPITRSARTAFRPIIRISASSTST